MIDAGAGRQPPGGARGRSPPERHARPDASTVRAWPTPRACGRAVRRSPAESSAARWCARFVERPAATPTSRRSAGLAPRTAARAERAGRPGRRLREEVRDDDDRGESGCAPDRPTSTDDHRAAVERSPQRAAAEGLVDVAWATIDTPIGELLLAARPRPGWCGSAFGGEDERARGAGRPVSPRVLRAARPTRPGAPPARRVLRGRGATTSTSPVDWSLSPRLPAPGARARCSARSASARSSPTASSPSAPATPRRSRAVGSAMATNPIPIVVPVPPRAPHRWRPRRLRRRPRDQATAAHPRGLALPDARTRRTAR